MDSEQGVRAVVFDYKTIFRPSGTTPHPGISVLLGWLEQRGIAWVLLTMNGFDADGGCAAAGLPGAALHLTQDDVSGKKRGNKAWLETAAQKLDLRTNQLLMVGATEFDWYTSLNAGVMHVHATWAKSLHKQITSITASDPGEVRRFLEQFLLKEPVWAFRLDDPPRVFRMRSLLPPNTVLPGRSPQTANGTFRLQDVFTRKQSFTVGKNDARELLMLHLLCSAYLDGTLPGGGSLFCVYPSSTVGKVNEQLASYLDKAKVIVGARYKPKDPLLQRVSAAPDTSLERWRANQQGRVPNISIVNQATTIRVNPNYKGKLNGKTVIVFDDFTTTGISLEWARILLTQAGVAEVIALTVGKYPKPHIFHALHPGVAIDPYSPNAVSAADFTTTSASPGFGAGPAQALHQTFEQIISEEGGADRAHRHAR